MRFVHGTSTANLSAIENIGLAPPAITDNVTERRQARLDVVHVLEEKHVRLAGGYALRSVVHFGGEPIIVLGEIPDKDVDVAISGRNAFPDIYSTPSVGPELITGIIAVDQTLEDMSDLFKAHKS